MFIVPKLKNILIINFIRKLVFLYCKGVWVELVKTYGNHLPMLIFKPFCFCFLCLFYQLRKKNVYLCNLVILSCLVL